MIKEINLIYNYKITNIARKNIKSKIFKFIYKVLINLKTQIEKTWKKS